MLRIAAAVSMFLMPSAVLAGAQYCNDDVPYYVEKIPFGYALVHGAWAEYCKQNIQTDSTDYFCDGRDDYRLQITVNDDDLTLTSTQGGDTEFYSCIMDHDT